jgi:hypothetical protein
VARSEQGLDAWAGRGPGVKRTRSPDLTRPSADIGMERPDVHGLPRWSVQNGPLLGGDDDENGSPCAAAGGGLLREPGPAGVGELPANLQSVFRRESQRAIATR